MFGKIQGSLKRIIRNITKKGILTSELVKEGLTEIKKSLIEADVNIDVAEKFVKDVEKIATGERVLKSFNPYEMLLKIVYDELIRIIGNPEPLKLSRFPSVIMLLGLQGSGKTTTSVKLAKLLKKKGKNPVLVPCDVKRPAAFEQLKDLAIRYELPYFPTFMNDAVKLAKSAMTQSILKRYDVIIFDTAGRLHIDEDMIKEAIEIKENTKPEETILVVDGMTGQDAVNIAREFDKRIGITGIILTKMDGDERGGAVLSVREVTGKPIKFMCVGEKIDDIEDFRPEGIASRILGMGDIRELQEKAKTALDAEKQKEFQEKLKKAELNLEDFLEQIKGFKKMGSMEKILEMIPGGEKFKDMMDDKALIRTEAIINSMTKEERKNPSIIDGSRKRRIAKGSGTTVQEINRLLKEYEMVVQMMKQMKKGKGFNIPFLRGF